MRYYLFGFIPFGPTWAWENDGPLLNLQLRWLWRHIGRHKPA